MQKPKFVNVSRVSITGQVTPSQKEVRNQVMEPGHKTSTIRKTIADSYKLYDKGMMSPAKFEEAVTYVSTLNSNLLA